MVQANQHHFINISSPGRINVIGEHLDYNGGHVLPGIIDLATIIHQPMVKIPWVSSLDSTKISANSPL